MKPQARRGTSGKSRCAHPTLTDSEALSEGGRGGRTCRCGTPLADPTTARAKSGEKLVQIRSNSRRQGGTTPRGSSPSNRRAGARYRGPSLDRPLHARGRKGLSARHLSDPSRNHHGLLAGGPPSRPPIRRDPMEPPLLVGSLSQRGLTASRGPAPPSPPCSAYSRGDRAAFAVVLRRMPCSVSLEACDSAEEALPAEIRRLSRRRAFFHGGASALAFDKAAGR